jgi:hypothetical protein
MEYQLKKSKQITIERVENGWIINVEFIEVIDEVGKVIVSKKYVAMTEKEKEQVIQNLRS